MNTQPKKTVAIDVIIARIAWFVPLFFLVLSVYEAKVSIDLNRTARDGIQAVADVTRYERADRKDVTQAELDLSVVLPDGSTFTREKLALPYSIAHRVEKDTVHVRVLRNAPQEVVLLSIVGTQIRIAMSNAAMGFIAMLMALAGVIAWNRYLGRQAAEPL